MAIFFSVQWTPNECWKELNASGPLEFPAVVDHQWQSKECKSHMKINNKCNPFMRN